MLAYVTVLTNEKYVKGVLAMAKSLHTVRSSYPLFVLIPDDKDNLLSSEMCEKYGIQIIYTSHFSELPNSSDSYYWKDTVYKLKVFALTQFEKIVYIDSDMVILKNIDHLFQAPHLSAANSGACLYPEWNNINSGIIVISPNEQDYEAMISCIDVAYKKRIEQGLPFGDQDVIKEYVPDWPNKTELHLSEAYNCMLGYADILKRKNMIASKEDIFVYHFTGQQKPWQGYYNRFICMLKILKRGKTLFHSIDLSIFFDYIRLANSL